MSELKNKINWLESKGINIYEAPSIKNGKLKARNFPNFVYETLKYLKIYKNLDYWKEKKLIERR